MLRWPTSLPSRGAWIEIVELTGHVSMDARRSPHGERGLKYLVFNGVQSGKFGSLPSRGAWIEITSRRSGGSPPRVAPLTGSVD